MPLIRSAVLAGIVAGVLAVPATARDLTLESYFAGHTYAYGKFSAINGKTREFRVYTTGRRLSGHRFNLTEDIHYTDGAHEVKTWHFTRTGPTTYVGTRGDVVGKTTVHLEGNTARFSYLVDLDPGPKKKAFRFHDTLVLENGGVLRNSSWVTKLIFPVARVHVNFAHSKAVAERIKPQ